MVGYEHPSKTEKSRLWYVVKVLKGCLKYHLSHDVQEVEIHNMKGLQSCLRI